MLLEGKVLSGKIKEELKIKLGNKKLRLDIILVGDNLASQKYVERKKKFGEEIGVEVVVHEYQADVLESDLFEEVKRLDNDEKVNGLIVQLPLPKQIDPNKILTLISSGKDVDALTREPRVLSPMVGAIKEIFDRSNISLKNKKIAVIGNGKLVGQPVSVWLSQEGYDVSIIDLETKNSAEIIKEADVVISGVGKPGLITPDKIKKGVVLIDAGTSESGGQLYGDADPACAEKCSLFTPVPGGVGPLTVAMLFKNLLKLKSWI